MKCDCSMLIESLDMAPVIPKKRIRSQDLQDSELFIN
jgi:hypothetical protein